MRLEDSVDLIDGTNANVYVIKTGGIVVQVDTGMRSNLNKIISYYEDEKIIPDIIFITHYHMDHVGTLGFLQKKYNPVVIASETEREYLEGRSIPESPRSIMGKMISAFSGKLNFNNIKTCDSLPDENLECVATPGHTPGSVSLLMKKEKFLFIGDAARTKNGQMETIGTFTLDPLVAEQSIEKITSMKPVKIFPGHGDPVNLK